MNAKNQKPMQLQRRPTNLTPAQRKKNSDFVSLLVSSLSNRLHKSKMGLMNERFNPLWNMSSQQAQMIYDYARSGNFAQLQYLYNEIENSDPTFLTCVTRRCSAMSTLDWRVVAADERPIRRKLAKLNDLKNLRQEQIYCLEESLSKIDNIPDALDHFALSAFRGFSVVNTWHDYTGTPTHLECLDHWNMCFDKKNGVWLWNKDGVSYMNPSKDSKQMLEIPREDMVAVTRKRQIDWPAMKIFLRNAVGERDWGRFLETYGLPPVIITMPEFTSDKEKDAYLAAAESVFEGRSGVVPFGSEVNYASESRGTDPFSAFIEHQMKLFVLLSTGGTLTSLSEAGSGTLAGNAQMKVWEQIIFSDRRITSNCINKQLCETILKKNFKDQPVLAEFQLYAKPDFTPDELADLAGKFSQAGFEMDAQELSQATGLKIAKKVEPAEIPFNGQPGPTPDPDDPEPEVIEIPDTGTPHPIATNEGGNGDVIEVGESQIEEIAALPAPRPGDEPEKPSEGNHPPAAPSAQRANPERLDAASELARSLQQDFKGLADELVKIVALPEEERRKAAAELLAKVNDYVSDDPAMADVIYDQMKEAFGVQIEKHPDGDVPTANKAVPNAKQSGQTGKTRWVTIGHAPVLVDEDGNPVGDSKAATEARKAEFPYESDVSKWPAGPTEKEIAEKPYKEFKAVTKARLENAVNKAWCEGVDVPDAATVWYKKKDENGKVETVKIDIDIGKEDFNGKGGHGLLHIATDHAEELIKKIPTILAAGKYYHDENQKGTYMIVYKDNVLSLKPKENGKFRIASCYEARERANAYTRRGGQVLNCVLVAEDE